MLQAQCIYEVEARMNDHEVQVKQKRLSQVWIRGRRDGSNSSIEDSSTTRANVPSGDMQRQHRTPPATHPHISFGKMILMIMVSVIVSSCAVLYLKPTGCLTTV